MELRVLKYFLVVAREKNITRASKMLHITQPTLSRQLHQLEEEFGTTLFRRGKHNISLTTAGLLLYRRASEFAELEEKTAQDKTLVGGLKPYWEGSLDDVYKWYFKDK